MAGKRERGYVLWYGLAVAVLLGVIGLFSEGRVTSLQVSELPTAPSTPLNNAIEFLRAFGFFNVVLPFLLIFAIVFGVLEKSKLFGTEKVDKKEYPRRNLNSIVAFCIAFFVVAAANITGVIQATVPQIAFVLVVIISFLLLFGTLLGEGEFKLWEKTGLRYVFVVAIFIAMIGILLGGFGVLDDLLFYLAGNFSGTFITTLIFVIIIVGAMWFVAHKPKEKGGEK